MHFRKTNFLLYCSYGIEDTIEIIDKRITIVGLGGSRKEVITMRKQHYFIEEIVEEVERKKELTGVKHPRSSIATLCLS